MDANRPSLHRLAELLRSSLAQVRVSLLEVDRRLRWQEGTLERSLAGSEAGSEAGGEGLRVKDLLGVLRAAGIEERAFFAALYDLEPKRRAVSEQGEIPYSFGHLADGDAPSFPPMTEILELFRDLTEKGVDGQLSAHPRKAEMAARWVGERDLLDRPVSKD